MGHGAINTEQKGNKFVKYKDRITEKCTSDTTIIVVKGFGLCICIWLFIVNRVFRFLLYPQLSFCFIFCLPSHFIFYLIYTLSPRSPSSSFDCTSLFQYFPLSIYLFSFYFFLLWVIVLLFVVYLHVSIRQTVFSPLSLLDVLFIHPDFILFCQCTVFICVCYQWFRYCIEDLYCHFHFYISLSQYCFIQCVVFIVCLLCLINTSLNFSASCL